MMEINHKMYTYTQKKQKAATLAAFRILFGILMLVSLVRFLSKGWVDQFYVKPEFHFKYYGFSWVTSLGEYTYCLFGIAILACVGIILGFKYRLSIIVFFLSFTYIELIDKTTYLNHYYFISLLSFILCFLPLHAYFSIDAYQKQKAYQYVPKWTVDSIKLLLGIVYFYAGLAKLNSDWLLRAQPLKTWLSTKTDFPLIGKFMNDSWFHYAMSWSGAVYDLTIPFLLCWKRARPLAFIAVVVFHIFTRILFNIGMFPYIMIVATTIFFSDHIHQKILQFLSKILKLKNIKTTEVFYNPNFYKKMIYGMVLFVWIQLILPFRYMLYPGELFWTEEGYRFSWRVMLMEKYGETSFRIVDYNSGQSFIANNDRFLNTFQKKEMSTQPDFILEFAHYLGSYYKEEFGHKNIGVFVEGFVTLNARRSRPLINPDIDLLKVKESFKHKDWILPLGYEIKGL